MKKFIQVVLIFVLSLQVVNAQSSADSAETEQPKTNKSKEADKKAAANERKPKPNKQVFKPTEEISEDSPVPFPVDI